MKKSLVLLGMLLVSVGLAAPAAAATDMVEVRLEQDRATAVRGERFTVQSRITNLGTAPTQRFMAHLNVMSVTGAVSVDPEDWSALPIHEVAALDAGSSASLTWELQAGDVGSFELYVVLVPVGADSGVDGPLVVSRPLHVDAAGRNTLDAGGALPVVIVVPVLVGIAAVAGRLRARRVR